ncbi:hypothetical protein CF326_g6891 [Tilletia indica]|nr:hypothetical protein CF326_g6891 [Tilletia indica]
MSESASSSSRISFSTCQPLSRSTDKSVLWVSHASMVVRAICVGLLGVVLYEIGIQKGIRVGVPPVCAALCAEGSIACVYGSFLGFGLAFIFSLVTTQYLFGELTFAPTSAEQRSSRQLDRHRRLHPHILPSTLEHDFEKARSDKASQEGQVISALDGKSHEESPLLKHKHEGSALDLKTEGFTAILSIILNVFLILLIPAYMCILEIRG